MEWTLLLLVLIASHFSQSNALRCHICSHSKSWEYCEKQRTTHKCSSTRSQQPTCFKLEKYRNFVNSTRDFTFSTGCIYSQYCNVSYMCTSKESCKLNCCNTDLCNTASPNGRIANLYTVPGIVASFIFRIILS